jgi:protein-tyrosine phosphatase
MGLTNMFSGNKKNTSFPDLSSIAADMHSHLLPGIDDGVKSIDESLRLLRKFCQLGYKKIITTPHINARYPNNAGIIRDGLATLKQAVADAGIPLQIEAAAEYYMEDGFEKILEQGDLLTFGDNYLLIEMPYYIPYPLFSQTVYDIQMAGYNIILAHAERYAYWHKNMGEFEKLKARDIMIQVNFMSLSIFNPVATRKTARMLIDAGFVDFAGSDVHNEMYMSLALRGMRNRYTERLMASGTLKNATLL